MGLLRGDCPGVAPPPEPGERGPTEGPVSPSSDGTQHLGASQRVGRSRTAGWAGRGAGGGGPTLAQGTGRRDPRPAGTAPPPPPSTRAHGPRAGELGRGTQRYRDGQQAAEPPFPQWPSARKTLPRERGKRAPPWAWDTWQGLRTGWASGGVPGTGWHPGPPRPPAGRAQ